MRTALAVVVALAVGFGAGLLFFEQPWSSGKPNAAKVETKLLQRERAAGRKADGADCKARQGTSNQYLCTVLYDVQGGVARGRGASFLATVDGDSIRFERRGIL